MGHSQSLLSHRLRKSDKFYPKSLNMQGVIFHKKLKSINPSKPGNPGQIWFPSGSLALRWDSHDQGHYLIDRTPLMYAA